MNLKWIVYLALAYCALVVIRNNPLVLIFLIVCFVGYKFLTKKRKPGTKSLEKQLALLRNSIDSLNSFVLNSNKAQIGKLGLNSEYITMEKIPVGAITAESNKIRYNTEKNKSYKLYSYLEKLNNLDMQF